MFCDRFVRAFRERVSPEQRPIVVHCSAGVGRSGTMIAIDRILQGIRKYDVVDIFGIVYEMRKERVWMVQTEQQYICIHQVSIKLIITNKALPIHMNISCYCSACCLCWRGRSTRRGSPWSCTTTRLSRTTRGSPSPACDWWRAGHVTTVRSSDWSTRRGNVIKK